MGGSLLKGRRISTKEYYEVIDDLVLLVSNSLLPDMSVNQIPFIREKEDHGDIDLVIGYEDGVDYVRIYESLNNQNNVSQIISNSSNKSIHFLYDGVQVDLIFIQNKSVEYAVNYFSYNDLGNLLGRMSKRLGFKHGHLGLSFKLMHNTTVIK